MKDSFGDEERKMKKQMLGLVMHRRTDLCKGVRLTRKQWLEVSSCELKAVLCFHQSALLLGPYELNSETVRACPSVGPSVSQELS